MVMKEPKPGTRRRALLEPELERFIEIRHRRDLEQAHARDRMRVAWRTPGGEAIRAFVATRPSPATRRVYEHHLTRLVEWVLAAGLDDVLDLTPALLARYENDVHDMRSRRTGRRLALKTRHERIRTLKTFFQYCVDEGLVERSPARMVRVRGREEPSRRFLNDAEATALLASCNGGRAVDVRDRAIVTILLHTGLRVAEVASLTWGTISSAPAPGVRVEGKGHVVRTVPLSREALAALDAWSAACGRRRGGDAPIWVSVAHRLRGGASVGPGTWTVGDGGLSPAAVRRVVRRHAKRAGLSGVSPHALRRTFATKLKRLGVDLLTLQRYLGHASITTTVKYLHTSDDASPVVRELSYRAQDATAREE
jgi:site-specific recombinase XerD